MKPNIPMVALERLSQPIARPTDRVAPRAAKAALLTGALLTLGACAVPIGTQSSSERGISPDVMEQIAALAAPYQDLSTVSRRPGDGCYWYRHVGPVETTMLPLRTPDGSPICSEATVAS
jgi:hypothetical protein